VTDEFEAWSGRPPAGVWRAPGRVNLIGEHTDYNEGWVLPAAIGLGVTTAAAPRDDDRVRFRSLQEEAGDGWQNYPEGVLWALRREGIEVPGADVLVDADVPQGAGLSSSAALEVAVALALLGIAGASLEPERLALACQRAESEVVGMPCGPMDQFASVFGRAGHALLLDTRSLEREWLPLHLEAEGLVLLVVDTGVAHALRESAYGERRAACEKAARALGLTALRDATAADVDRAESLLGERIARLVHHVVSEDARVLEAAALLRAGSLAGLGPILNASHASLRDDFEVSAPELDTAVEAATGAGALGARMIGGGFGGSVLALVLETAFEASAAAVRDSFAGAGFSEPRVFAVDPADGAGRIG
jgi:galactokinase